MPGFGLAHLNGEGSFAVHVLIVNMVIFFRIPFARQTCLAVAEALAGFAWPGDTLAVDKNPGAIDFARDVRPLLSDNCFACHGPDAKKRKADLRLDTREGALADLGGTSAVIPGKPNESEYHFSSLAIGVIPHALTAARTALAIRLWRAKTFSRPSSINILTDSRKPRSKFIGGVYGK